MLEIKLLKRLGNWKLDIEFSSTASKLVIWGPSGSGKSLTLKLVAGIVKPESGYVRVGGKTLFDSKNGINLPSQERKVGVVFQNYALFPHLNVSQNLGFALGRGRQSADRVRDMAEKLEISRTLDLYPSQLSGGQSQRVALGRALLADPELVLLDEPFNALDMPLRTRVRCELRELLDEFALPFVIVTHDPEDVRALGEAVAVLENGTCSGVLAGCKPGELGPAFGNAGPSWQEAPGFPLSTFG